MQRLVCQQTQLELDALWDGKPMKAVLMVGLLRDVEAIEKFFLIQEFHFPRKAIKSQCATMRSLL